MKRANGILHYQQRFQEVQIESYQPWGHKVGQSDGLLRWDLSLCASHDE